MKKITWCWAALGVCATGAVAAPVGDGEVVMRTAMASNEDPFEAGKTAASTLKQALNGAEPHVVILADCFEDKENKEQVLKGVAAVFGSDKIVGGAFYGMFTQDGMLDRDAVALLGIAGESVSVVTALEEKMGAAGLSLEKDSEQLTKALESAGARLARKLPKAANPRLMILLADAHSPKNQLLLNGVQSVVGAKLPITGASVNKNAGQSWVYYHDKVCADSAVAILLSGGFTVGQSGRQAKDNDRVIATARESANEALMNLGREPFAVLAFDCAGRMGKLKNVGDELAAMQTAIGKQVVLFGCYGAGEFGPPDASDVADRTITCGRGWHVMVSALGR